MHKLGLAFLSALFFCLSSNAGVLERLAYAGVAVPFYNDSSVQEQQAFIDLAKSDHLAERMANLINASIALRSNIGVGFESCGQGQAGAFFSPQRRAIVVCSEFVWLMTKTAYDDKEFMMKLPKEQFVKGFNGLIWGVFLHELGHALIATNGVPVTGREEDVADQFAVWYAVNFIDLNQTPVIQPTIWFWGRMAKGRDIPSMSDQDRRSFMANEHSLDEQRTYNLACWYLGTGTESAAKTARFAGLPSERAQRCAGEYVQVNRGMKNLFAQYFKIKPLRGAW